MEAIKQILKDKKFKQKPIGRELLSFQRYALEVIEMFGIKKEKKSVINKKGELQWQVFNGPAIIFRYACNNLEFLKGKVENAKEKLGKENLKNGGRYLISMLRKK